MKRYTVHLLNGTTMDIKADELNSDPETFRFVVRDDRGLRSVAWFTKHSVAGVLESDEQAASPRTKK